MKILTGWLSRRRKRKPPQSGSSKAGSSSVPQTVSEERMAELRAQHLNGTYHVDPDKVAAKIVDEHLIK
jgi:anti-sigma28 factor (negative regulator of flagellin synthesis)